MYITHMIIEYLKEEWFTLSQYAKVLTLLIVKYVQSQLRLMQNLILYILLHMTVFIRK